VPRLGVVVTAMVVMVVAGVVVVTGVVLDVIVVVAMGVVVGTGVDDVGAGVVVVVAAMPVKFVGLFF
jgi:hypothetical protein